MTVTHQFSLVQDRYHGRPVLEILKDDEAFWEDLPGAKKNFRFGTRKAVALLASLDVIENFVQTDGRDPTTDKSLSVKSNKWGSGYSVLKRAGFERAGHWFDAPYLVISGNDVKIQFGLVKANAVLLMTHEIQEFAIRNY